MQGKDFSKLYLAEQAPEWRQEFYYEHPTIRDKNFIPSSEALVSKEWKYIHWPEFETEELYHLKVDPFEENNLISDDKYKETRVKLKQRMIEARAVVQAPAE
jgi:arylsulfatase